MPSRLLPRRDESGTNQPQQQLPFTADNSSDTEFSQDQLQNDYGSNTLPRSRPIRAAQNAPNSLSSSYTPRNPLRSFAHQTSHSSVVDSPQYSSQGVRERTQELASYALNAEAYKDPRRRANTVESDNGSTRRATTSGAEGRTSFEFDTEDIVEEDSEHDSIQTVIGPERRTGNGSSSMASQWYDQRRGSDASRRHLPDVVVEDTENTPLLPKARLSRSNSIPKQKDSKTSAHSPPRSQSFRRRIGESFAAGRGHLAQFGRNATNPKNYTKDAVVKGTLASLQMSSAVFLGLLLNILDALSYGYILFPLGSPIFSQTGPDGISIFFVSCIVSQLCYSLGLSAFRGGVGSEMIEVVPFFHKMAYSIMTRMEGQSAEAIMATTIVSYCMSSVVTGLIFLALGGFKLGNLVSFFPRHILIGCIGGVGFFLFVTGIEVSARLEGNLNYDLPTLHKLFAMDTVYLWMLPLSLAILILVIRRYIKSPVVLPAFFIAVFAVFYIVVKGILRLDLEHVRNAGWIFEKPEAGVPFYRFYSYFSRFH
jgi:SulP family sulfate permease